MEAEIKELNNLIQKINEPQLDVDSAKDISKRLILLLEKIFLNSGEKKFEIILNNYVIKPLIEKYNELNSSKSSHSRSKMKKRETFSQIIFVIEFVFNNYESFLKDNNYFISYKEKLYENEKAFRSLVLQDLDDDVDYDKFILLYDSKKELLSYLKNLDKKDNLETLNYRVKQIFNRLKELRNIIANKIETIALKIENTKNKISNDEDYLTEYLGMSYKEILAENLIDYEIEKGQYEKHYIQLQNLFEQIERLFPFIIAQKENENLLQFFAHNKVNDFISIENKLLDNSYLSKEDLGLKWNHRKVELVNFARYIKSNGFLKEYKELSPFIKFLENRYRINVGDQRKESKFKGTNSDINNDFDFLK